MPKPAVVLASLLDRLFKVEGRKWQGSRLLQETLKCASKNATVFLKLLADGDRPTDKRLRLLSLALSDPGQWPILELVRCLNRITAQSQKGQEDCSQQEALSASDPSLQQATQLVKDSYRSLVGFLEGNVSAGKSKRPALQSTTPGRHITHGTLYETARDFSLPLADDSGAVVAVAIANSPLLAAVCISVTCHYIAAPINPATSAEQFLRDVEQVRARSIITTRTEADRLGLSSAWARARGIDLFFAETSNDSNGDSEEVSIHLKDADGAPLSTNTGPARLNQPDDVSLLLFTSGTSGAKKVVPITLHSIVIGCVLVIESWGLSEMDVCINMMQLYHVGGLIRNIFSPILSGGSIVCCPAFDPTLFWDVVTEPRLAPTWYYASPTMHALILEEAKRRGAAAQDNNIRLVCNAAGGLLPSLASQLRDCFRCTILPSYGMTECMPISTPPLDYQLDRVGTSGVATGPDIAILSTSSGDPAPQGSVGSVCLRGSPLFQGYLRPDGSLDRSAFNHLGWFDTGDTGYRDADGFLYITGRSKEVINRGGELISPFEIEECVVAASGHFTGGGVVSQALAFPVSHDVLQETVGVALVCKPGSPRPDLQQLNAALRSSLQQAKWPALIVYMDDLPKRNNKIIRIGLATRLNLPVLSDDCSYLERHWEATCPPIDSEPSVPITATVCSSDCGAVERLLQSLVPEGVEVHARMAREFPGQCEAFIATGMSGWELNPDPTAQLKAKMTALLPGYVVPRCIHALDSELPRTDGGDVDDDALHDLIEAQKRDTSSVSEASGELTIKGRLIQLFADVLACHPNEVDPDKDFFSLGGDSLRAGRLLSAIRAELKVHLPVEMVFNNQGSVSNLAQYIDEHQPSASSSSGSVNTSEESPIHPDTLPRLSHSSTNPFLLIVQLLPLGVIHPMLRSVLYTAFLITLSHTTNWSTNKSVVGRLINLTFSAFLARMILHAIAPIVCILGKWIIIGRYKEGVYPMWGGYHTRWWLVQKLATLTGIGLFASTNATRILYLRLMGARIGRNVSLDLSISGNLGEWDLLDIGDSVVLDHGVIARPFAAAPGPSMYLAPIRVGANASVGRSSILAPGCAIPAGTCLGPNSSSWELASGAVDEANRDLTWAGQPSPHWALMIFVSCPLLLLSYIIPILPYFAGIVGLVLTEPLGDNNPVYGIVMWFAEPRRVGYHVLALILRITLRPFMQFGFAVLVKWILDLMFGKLPKSSSAKRRGHIERWRLDLQRKLLPVSKLHDMLDMFGSHYNATSTAIRLLGGRVGQRVYWPGTGPSISDYHLLDIGDDVVFGSRAHLVTSDGLGSEMIRIGNGAMIADRVTVLPGVTVGEKTTLGTGAVTRRRGMYAAHATYVGSKGGDAICLSNRRSASLASSNTKVEKDEETDKNKDVDQDVEKQEATPAPPMASLTPSTSPEALNTEKPASSSSASPQSSTITPFGRAFHQRQAPYHVLSPYTIFLYSSLLAALTALYWNVSSIGTIQIINRIAHAPGTPLAAGFWFDAPALYGLLAALIALLSACQVIVSLAFVTACKWLLLGRRQPGNYDWDKSSYCQRWQFFLGIERLRRSCIRGNGILPLLTGTHWIVLYFRMLGAKIGKDCALFANGCPTLMLTEPDLVTLGDRVAVDDASLVAHINTRGKFDLNRLEVGDGCVLRTGSRLLSGAAMKARAVLLEHTLVMAGDVVDEGVTLQGWPAERFTGKAVELGEKKK